MVLKNIQSISNNADDVGRKKISVVELMVENEIAVLQRNYFIPQRVSTPEIEIQKLDINEDLCSDWD